MTDDSDSTSSSRARRPAWTRPRGALALMVTAALASSIAVAQAIARHVISERNDAQRETVASDDAVRDTIASDDAERDIVASDAAADHDAMPQGAAGADIVVLRLERGGESGACHAFCAGEGVAWTAAHCVDGVTTLRVVDPSGRASAVDHAASPAAHDGSSAGDVTRRARDDHAELVLGDTTVCTARPNRASVRRGDSVALLRFGAAPRLGRAGRVGSGLLATSPLVCAGDSGAPLVDREGTLVGLAVGRSGLGCDEGASFFLALPPDASP